MKNLKYLIPAFVLFLGLISPITARAVQADTVRAGLYVTSIHDIDFKEKEFTANFWLWLKYKNKDLNFQEYLEIPNAKTVDKSFFTIDTSGTEVYLLMKIQAVMNDSWTIDNFPFDRQSLWISIENSQFDAESMVFVPDTLGEHFDPRFTLRGWTIDSLSLRGAVKQYDTAFGEQADTAHTDYSALRARIDISRESAGLFWKMFLGMYVAFLISFMCFFIHVDSIDSRFGLSVGALFAVIGNKYIIDSALPESSSFTLVDTLHGLTLFFILIVISLTAWTLRMVKMERMEYALKYDKLAAIALLATYILLNAVFIYNAAG